MPRSGPHKYDRYAQIHEKDTLEAVQARRLMAKKLGLAAIKGKDIDHIRSIKAGGTNAPKNLRVRSPHENRADKSFFDHGRAKKK